MKKELIFALMTLAMVMMITPLTAKGALSNDWERLQAVIQNDQSAISGAISFTADFSHDDRIEIRLTGDISAESTNDRLMIPSNTNIVIYLEGHNIDRNLTSSVENGEVFEVNGNLNILNTVATPGAITGGKNLSGYGGGIYVTSSSARLSMSGNVEVKGNDVYCSTEGMGGGGIYSKGTVNISNCKIENNHAIALSGSGFGDGGGIYLAEGSGNSNLTGTNFSNNTAARNGGGVYTAAFVQHHSATISHCLATNGGGLAIGANGSAFYEGANNYTITECTATEKGGGAYIAGGIPGASGTLFLYSNVGTGAKVTNCSAKLGGGIYNCGVVGLVGIVENNHADEEGGGIYAYDLAVFVGANAQVKTGNTKGASNTTSNVFVGDYGLLSVGKSNDVGVPNANTKIGVSMDRQAPFTENTGSGKMQYFFSDDSSKRVYYTSTGDLALYCPTVWAAQDLVYDGEEHVLLNGTTMDMKYCFGTETAPDGSWSNELPKAINGGTYYVWYMIPAGGGSSEDYVPTSPIIVAIRCEITVVPSEHGTVTPDKWQAEEDDIVVLTIAPASGYSLENIAGTYNDGQTQSLQISEDSSTIYTFRMPAYPVTITASFKQNQSDPPAPGPAPAPAPAPEKFTIPVTGDDTVQIEASISGGNAEVKEIKTEDIKNLYADSKDGNTGENSTVTIDLSTSKQKVGSVTLTKQSVKNLAEAANDEKSPVETVEIRLSNATIVLDSKALETISEQMKGQEIKIVVEDKTKEDLNAAQQEALEEVKVEGTFDAHVESNGVEVHEFNGGNVEVSLSFVPEQGKDPKHYFIYYVADDGSTEKFDTRYEGGRIIFITSHLSDYVIVYDETKTNSTKKAAKAPILKMKKTIGLGKKYALKVTNVAENAAVKFTSSDESVATVDKNGVIRATGLGECNIKCVIKQNGTSYKFRITVRVLENCKGNRQIKDSECLTPNSITPLLNIYKLVNEEKPVQLDIGKLTKKAKVTYTVEDESIASVSEGGVITGLADGTTGISVYVTQKGQTYQYRLFVRVSTK